MFHIYDVCSIDPEKGLKESMQFIFGVITYNFVKLQNVLHA